MQEAAKAAIPRGYRPDSVPWWHPDIDRAIERRDEAFTLIGEKDSGHDEWLQACQEVQRVIKIKRDECWRELQELCNIQKTLPRLQHFSLL